MSTRSKTLIGICALIVVGALAAWAQRNAERRSTELTAVPIESYPHDPRAFTQGLVFHGGILYESTGQYGRSSIRRVDLETGQVLAARTLNQRLFGEGLAIHDDKLYQLTWKSGLAIVYDIESLDVIETLRYDGEGWGLTYDGESLILSDGTPELRFLDPATFEVRRRVRVMGANGPVANINELEYVDGEIWANIWYEDVLIRVDPRTGNVVGTVDLSSLYAVPERDREQVANGIAYDAASSRLFLTGKYWPLLFEVDLVAE